MPQYTPYTQDEWPGPPVRMPPRIDPDRRTEQYINAAMDTALTETIYSAFCDLGRRLAERLKARAA